MKSRRGIFYDLSKSTWRLTVGNYDFVFSSKLHMDKFRERYEDHREGINKSLSARFNIEIDASVIADVVLYRKIETRGFLIVAKEGKLSCPEKMQVVGGRILTEN